MKTTLMKAAVAVSTIISLGAPAALAAQKNQDSHVRARSRTDVTSVTTSLALSENSIRQRKSGGGSANQNAEVKGDTTSAAVSNVTALSGNVVVVTQE